MDEKIERGQSPWLNFINIQWILSMGFHLFIYILTIMCAGPGPRDLRLLAQDRRLILLMIFYHLPVCVCVCVIIYFWTIFFGYCW